MKNSKADAERWLKQAENDLEFSRLALREGYYSQACFMSHQVAEKGLKAMAYFMGDRYVLGHSLASLLADLEHTYPDIRGFQGVARRLDQFYVPTRYPDALPGGTPFETYDQQQANEAVDGAASVVEFARVVVHQ